MSEDPEINSLRSEVTALRQAFGAKLNEENEQAVRQAREREIGTLETRRRTIAVSNASPQERARQFEAVTNLEQQTYARHRAEDRERQKRQQAPAQQTPLPQELADWSKRNPWFFALKQARSSIADEAEAIHVALNAQGMPLAENLEEVTRRMSEQYPHLVEPAGGEKKQSRVDRSWDAIPAEDREIAMSSLLNKGIYGKDKTKAKELYAKSYWNQNSN